MSLHTLGLISDETMREHRARWFVWTGDGSAAYPREKIPHSAQMRGQWGYDVTCSCGEWESQTGGATRRSVQDALDDHRWAAQCDAAERQARS